MLRLTRPRIYRISNRLAGFAALLLIVTSLTDIGGSSPAVDSDSIVQAASPAAEEAPELLNSANTVEIQNNKGFKISLFLFRNH